MKKEGTMVVMMTRHCPFMSKSNSVRNSVMEKQLSTIYSVVSRKKSEPETDIVGMPLRDTDIVSLLCSIISSIKII